MVKWLTLLSMVLFPGIVSSAITFDSSFESGNGTEFTEVLPNVYSFEIEPDTNSTDRQWFYFEVAGADGQNLTFQLLNANQTNVQSHWNLARPIVSADEGETWILANGSTSYDGGTYTFSHTITGDPVRIAFHYPYTHSYHQQRIAEWAAHDDVTHEVIGKSVQGRDIDLLRITNDASAPFGGKLGIWITARQHAAEVTGSWMGDGFIDFVLSDAPMARVLRDKTVINIVPMVNPDGVFIGNYRDNANGYNLNRSWDDATLVNDPEIVHVLNAIAEWVESGKNYTFFADLHSTSGGTTNFAFHAAPGVEFVAYPTPSTYDEDSQKFLNFVEDYNDDFDADSGDSSSLDTRLSRQNQADNHGILAVLFEGMYNYTSYGSNVGKYMTPERHRAIGSAFAKALYEYYLAPDVVHGWSTRESTATK